MRQKDFESLNSSNVKKRSDRVMMGKLSDGRIVISRGESTDNRATLEIQERTSSGKVEKIKIRYNDEQT